MNQGPHSTVCSNTSPQNLLGEVLELVLAHVPFHERCRSQ